LYSLSKELRFFIQNLSENEKFILGKLIGQIKYDKILNFDDK